MTFSKVFALILLLSLSAWAQEPRLIATNSTVGLLPLYTADLSKLEAAVGKQLNEAETTLEKVLAEGDNLNSSEAYGEMAELYHAYALLDQAEVCYRNTLMLNEARYSSVYLFATFLQERAELDEASQLLDKFLKKHTDFAAGWYRKGEMSLNLVQLDDAEKAFQRARELRPQLSAPEAGLGRVAMQRKDFPAAISHFERALTLLPQANRLNYFLATAWRSQGDLDKARTYMASAGKIGPKMPDPITARLKEHATSERLFLAQGKTALAAGDLKSAADLYGKALEANPDSSAALTNLGSVLAQMGNTKQAVNQFRKALELNDKNPHALYNLGMLLPHQGKAAEGASLLEKLLESKPDDMEASYALALLYQDMKAYEKALALFDTLAKKLPTEAKVIVQRAQLILHLGQFDRAATVLEADLQRNPTMGQLAHLYARFLASCPKHELRQGERAKTLAESVVKADPSTFHLETLALAHAQLGECAEAANAQQRSIYAALAADIKGPQLERLQADLVRYEKGAPCSAGD